MTLETFFVKFNEFADAPGAVAKMRELVLQLAVQGRLVPKDPKDEPAAVTFPKLKAKAIESENDRFPTHWLRVPLGGAGKWRAGGTPAKSRPEFWKGDLPWVSPKDMKVLHISDAQDHISIAAIEGSSVQLIPAGSLLMVVRGMILARAFPVALTTREVTINQDMKALLLSEPSTKDYLLVALRALEPEVLAAIERSSHGTCKLKTQFLDEFLVPIPPLAEQRRIVAKVDELMALCDWLEAQRQERETRHAVLARAALARFADAPTPANLQLLFHHSYAIPPADLRKTILTIAVQANLVSFEPDGVSQTVGDHIEFQNGYAFKSQWFKPAGVRLCRNANVSHGVLDWGESAFVDDDIAKEFERFSLSEGDIVLSLDRPLITTGLKVARVRKSDLPCLLLQRVAKPVPKHDQIDMSYFLLWLNSSEFVDSIDPGRSNGVPHISTRQVQHLPFALPPLADQRRIVAKVDELMAMVDKLEAQLAASRATAANLLSAVVSELTALRQP